MLDNGDLLIRRINWLENMGLYTCVAENEHGSDQKGIFLYPVSRLFLHSMRDRHTSVATEKEI